MHDQCWLTAYKQLRCFSVSNNTQRLKVSTQSKIEYHKYLRQLKCTEQRKAARAPKRIEFIIWVLILHFAALILILIFFRFVSPALAKMSVVYTKAYIDSITYVLGMGKLYFGACPFSVFTLLGVQR